MAEATSSQRIADFTIQVNDLGKRFNSDWIFKGLTYTFSSGKTYAITGPNGSGKSTLLQVLWGQMPPSSGTVAYSKNELPVEMDNLHHHIAIATPYMDIIDEFTLREQLTFHFGLRKMRNGLTIDSIIEKMNLGNAQDRPIGNFSSGMRQRVKLGLAFFTQSDVIFLDEPGTNLDKLNFAWYKDQLAQLHHHVICIIASNDPAEYPENVAEIDILSLKGGYS